MPVVLLLVNVVAAIGIGIAGGVAGSPDWYMKSVHLKTSKKQVVTPGGGASDRNFVTQSFHFFLNRCIRQKCPLVGDTDSDVNWKMFATGPNKKQDITKDEPWLNFSSNLGHRLEVSSRDLPQASEWSRKYGGHWLARRAESDWQRSRYPSIKEILTTE